MKFIRAILLTLLLSLTLPLQAAVNPDDLLSPEQAFIPTVLVSDQGVQVDFQVADGYYLYQSKMAAHTAPESLLGKPQFSRAEEKEDEFFGKQQVYHRHASVSWAYLNGKPSDYRLTVSYQGCAEAGVCYPPAETVFNINGVGVYMPETAEAENVLVKKLPAAVQANGVFPYPTEKVSGSLKLSRDNLWLNLLVFFLSGIGLSFTACMYPLLPIVSGIVVGDKRSSKRRAFALSCVYVQGLAFSYTLAGILAGLTGALLTVWLQQAWVVLGAAALMAILALSMFGAFRLELPAAIQSYFQNQSNRLSGGHTASVFVMGILSALIVGPCVAPPLAAALGYIGQTGDALLGGLLLYALALGTGLPLIAIAVFGGHILPRAGEWMDGIRYVFGFLLLAVAVYLAAPFLGYAVSAILYTLLLIAPALWLFYRSAKLSGCLKAAASLIAALLAMGGLWFGYQSSMGKTTHLHDFLRLYAPAENKQHPIHRYSSVAELRTAMQSALQNNPTLPVMLDFYADWCVTCREMEAKTFSRTDVRAAVPMDRLFQIDVSSNTEEQRALLKEYGAYGLPALFAVYADGRHSEPVAGFLDGESFIAWWQSMAAKQHTQ